MATWPASMSSLFHRWPEETLLPGYRHIFLPSCWIFLSTPLSRSLKALLSWLTASYIVPINRMEKKIFSSSVFSSISFSFFKKKKVSIKMKWSKWVLWAPVEALWMIFQYIQGSLLLQGRAWVWKSPGIGKTALQRGLEPQLEQQFTLVVFDSKLMGKARWVALVISSDVVGGVRVIWPWEEPGRVNWPWCVCSSSFVPWPSTSPAL